jgi:hypothetical protein
MEIPPVVVTGVVREVRRKGHEVTPVISSSVDLSATAVHLSSSTSQASGSRSRGHRMSKNGMAHLKLSISITAVVALLAGHGLRSDLVA